MDRLINNVQFSITWNLGGTVIFTVLLFSCYLNVPPESAPAWTPIQSVLHPPLIAVVCSYCIHILIMQANLLFKVFPLINLAGS